MGQVLHRGATTTEAVRRAIQHSQESLRALARAPRDQPEDGGQVEEALLGGRPSDRAEDATVYGAVDRAGGHHRRLSQAHPAAARRLPLCVAGHDPAVSPALRFIAVLNGMASAACPRSRATCPTGKSSTAIRSATSTSISPRCAPPKASSISSSPSTALPSSPSCSWSRSADSEPPPAFLEALIAAVPYQIHTVLTDNGIQFADLPKNRGGPRPAGVAIPSTGPAAARRHRASPHQAEPSLDQRPGRAHEPHHQGSHRQTLPLRQPRSTHAHLADFINAYNFAKRLKSLAGLTPYEFICKCWQKEPHRFTPIQPIKSGTEHLASFSMKTFAQIL